MSRWIGVAHLRHFREHHGAAGPHDQVGREADGGIGGDAGEGVAAAALQPDDQIGGRAGFPPAPVQPLQAPLGHLQHGVDHVAEAVERLVLQLQNGRVRCPLAALAVCRRHQPFRLQLFAAEADDHHLAAEVGVAREVLQGADRHDGGRAR